MRLSTSTVILTSSLLSLALWPAAALAQSSGSSSNVVSVECDGESLDGLYADVIVKGAGCTLDGATVFGSVNVESGNLDTLNGTEIQGRVEAKDAGDVSLAATRVFGDVRLEKSGDLTVADSETGGISLKDSGDAIVGALAMTDELILESSGDATVFGAIAGVVSKNSGSVTLSDATVFPGGVFVSEACLSAPCGSSAVSVSGGSIKGSIIVGKSTGDVRVQNAVLDTSDLIVVELTGSVVVGGADAGVTLSDVNVEKSKGSITLTNVTTDSDVKIIENPEGHVSIAGSTVGSDVRIFGNQMVSLTGNSFSGEDLLVNKNGPVTIDSNCDMRLTVTENGPVTLTNNRDPDPADPNDGCVSGFGFSDADVSKNQGGVMITNNTGEGLYCSDNDPAPTPNNTNTITFSDGQCAGF